MALLPLQVFALALLADVYLYGIYSLLCTFTLFILFSSSRKIKGNVTNKCLVGATLVMYLVSTANVVLHAVDYLYCLALVDPVDNPMPKSANVYIATQFFYVLSYSISTVNFIFGDAIVVWRLWVIWMHSWRITIGPLILLFCTSAVVVAQIVTTVLSLSDTRAVSTDPGDPGHFMPSKLFFASLVLTLCTNGVATGLIAYRTWIHHRSSQAVHTRLGRDRALAVLLLLVESGALYCVIWLYLIIMWPSAASHPQLTYRFTDVIPQLTGMYPTAIIVICALRRSYADTVMSAPEYPTPIVFAPNGKPVPRTTRLSWYHSTEGTMELRVSPEGSSSRPPVRVSMEDVVKIS
ncbi:hypothetical protein FA95DRAFT_1679003 [Auriscalpium vulgare]|uniref:Uncharacterized protein n=1 Tax=Auriscalpium vulgare TaxID=40419 RepID=A0ACB8RTS2_9AGAM|nr:hypothetical protein FA95DRAFT_1679003 [Auriscalpium vulgare]